MINQPAFKDEKPPVFDDVLRRMLEKPPVRKNKGKTPAKKKPTEVG